MTTQLKILNKITEFHQIEYVTPCGTQADIAGDLVPIFDIVYELPRGAEDLFIINGEAYVWVHTTAPLHAKLKYTSNILRSFKHAQRAKGNK